MQARRWKTGFRFAASLSRHSSSHIEKGFLNVGVEVNEIVGSLVSSATSIFEFSALNISKQSVDLSTYRPKVGVPLGQA
jgi:hypothetical protein